MSDIPVPKFVLDLAKDFSTTCAERIKSEYGVTIDSPDIAPLPDGSIDILWYNRKGKMLVNISQDKKAYYYSDFHNRANPIKGNFFIVENGVYESNLGMRLKNIFTL